MSRKQNALAGNFQVKDEAALHVIRAKTKHTVTRPGLCELFVFVVAVAVVVVCLFSTLQYHSTQYSRTLDFPGGSVVKVCLQCMVSIPRLGRSPGEGYGNPLQWVLLYILARETPRTEESGGLQTMGSDKNQTQSSD